MPGETGFQCFIGANWFRFGNYSSRVLRFTSKYKSMKFNSLTAIGIKMGNTFAYLIGQVNATLLLANILGIKRIMREIRFVIETAFPLTDRSFARESNMYICNLCGKSENHLLTSRNSAQQLFPQPLARRQLLPVNSQSYYPPS